MALPQPVVACSAGFEALTPARLMVDGPLPGPENMAKDQALLDAAPNAAEPVVRFFRWREPTVSFGRTQKEDDARTFAASVGARALVRRPTGGGMVLHDNDLSLSIAWRRGSPGFPTCIKNVYRGIHEALAAALAAEGYAVSLYQPAPQRPPGQCFVEPVEADVMWEGKKVIGGALRVAAGGRLYQGDIQTAALGANPDRVLRRAVAALGRLFLFRDDEVQNFR
ncbi:MAG: lipoate--protein ligase family protein [Elusimicrobia bacterium]|nr:lipoate--protein ligase family protein [Elusimicrobiota bacterium]